MMGPTAICAAGLPNACAAPGANPNDADRLRKYLARFGLDWKQLNSAD
ncbi:hypothetical protein HX867_25610 [Pseudomonas gingeri]|nr:hypothetical protein [Pseudomonas gingeri]NVZ65485.1 hypothetical protein [Pseudomonas gingeri]NVZ77345.1 hypothetical protein [Pseudomonas gingeri]